VAYFIAHFQCSMKKGAVKEEVLLQIHIFTSAFSLPFKGNISRIFLEKLTVTQLVLK
jgi:hypothetical protein